ncbi:MAG: cytochrome c biogenesis CcdA family protein [Methylocystis sp.]|uniref:cytochrome c biogenesis CcdA family protein n=1 Tax=Methylocystis sp. TaxID=1911079 RepID=UPI003DA2DE7E
MGAATLGLAFVAGILSALSPCVLPLLPLVLGAAAVEHRWAPVLLACGVALSFVVIGLFVATLGFSIGLDDGAFRLGGAAIMVVLGVILLIPGLQARVTAAAGPLSDRLNSFFGGGPASAGLFGQFGVGLLLGAIWSPCVGPTLGAASLLASRGDDLAAVAATMGVFGLGAAAPLILLGLASRKAFTRWRESLLSAGKRLKQGMGLVFLALGLLIVSGADKSVEAALVTASPEWLTNLTTRF